MEELRGPEQCSYGRSNSTMDAVRAWGGVTTSWRGRAEASPTAEKAGCASIRPMADDQRNSRVEGVVSSLTQHGAGRVVGDDQRRLGEVGQEEQFADVPQSEWGVSGLGMCAPYTKAMSNTFANYAGIGSADIA